MEGNLQKKETWLITGGAGFVGAATAKELLARGREVIVYDNFCNSSLRALADIKNKITIIKADIAQAAKLAEAAKKAHVVLHLAARTSPLNTPKEAERIYKTNIQGTLNALRAAQASKRVRRFIFASSAAVYGDRRPPCAEHMPLAPLTPYAISKMRGEELCNHFQANNLASCIILRYFNVYGPGGKNSVVAKFLAAAKEGKKLPVQGAGTQKRDFVFIDDVVKANLWAAGVRPHIGNVYNVGTGKGTDLLKLGRAVERVLGKKVAAQHKPARKDDITRSWAHPAKARARLMNCLTTLKQGLDKIEKKRKVL